MITKIRNLIKNLINDNDNSDNESITWTIGNTLTLAQENVSSITQITKSGSVVDSANYTFDSTALTITFASGEEPSANDVIAVYYLYNKYSSTELLAYIKSALAYLDVNQYNPHFDLSTDSTELYPIPKPLQISLIASIASILIKPEYSEYRTGSVTIKFPKTKDRDAKIKELISYAKRSNGIIGIIQL